MSRQVINAALAQLADFDADARSGEIRQRVNALQQLLAPLVALSTDPLRILLDVDGVAANFVGPTLIAINRLKGTCYTVNDVTDYKMEVLFDLDADQRIALRQHTWGVPGFCRGLEPYPGAAEAVRRLDAIGEVYPVTMPLSALATWTSEREAWLFEHCGIDHSRVTHTGIKAPIHGDVLIEDDHRHLMGWQAQHPDGLGILWTRPYNVKAPWPGARVTAWDEVIALVQAKAVGR